MTAQTLISETPFCHAFGNEAVIPTEVGLASCKIAYHDEARNEEGICLQLDLLDEAKATAEQ